VAFLAARILAIPISAVVAPRVIVLTALLGTTVLTGSAAVYGSWAATGYVLAGATTGAVFPNAFSWISHELRGKANAAPLIVCMALLGGVTFPYLLGHLAAVIGIDGLLAAMNGLGLLAFLIVLASSARLPRMSRRRGSSQRPTMQ
jgi:fucose permease